MSGLGHNRGMRLALDYNLHWFIDDEIVTAVTLVGDHNIKLGPATFYSDSGSGVPVEVPMTIIDVRKCPMHRLSDDEIWATGSPGLDSLLAGLHAEGHLVNEDSIITLVHFQRHV